MIFDLISNMTLQMQNLVGPFMSCYPLLTDLKCGWEMGGANFSSSSYPSRYDLIKINKLWRLSQQGFCVLTNLRVKHLLHLYFSSSNQTDTQWRKVNQQFLTKMPKKDEADKQFETN